MEYTYHLKDNCETVKYKLLDDTKKKNKIYKGIGRSFRPLSIVNYSTKIQNKKM